MGAGSQPRLVRFDAFTLDLSRCVLLCRGVEVPLRRQAFDMLLYLAERPGTLVTKDELVKAIWRKVAVSDDSLARCISDIREALGDRDQRIVETVRGRGYLFAARTSQTTGSPPLPAAPAGGPFAHAPRSHLRRVREALGRSGFGRLALAVTLSSLLVLVAVGVGMLTVRPQKASAPHEQAAHYAILARALLDREHSAAANKQALALFDKALALDPNSMLALLGYARVMIVDVTDGWAPREEHVARLNQAEAAIARAIALDPKHARAYLMRGFLWRARTDPERALAAFQHALALEPGYAWARAEAGRTKIELGRADEAITDLEIAIRAAPAEPRLFNWYYWAGMAAVHAGQNELALHWLSKVRQDHPLDYRLATPWLAIALATSGREEEARAAMAEYLSRNPSYSISGWRRAFPPHTPRVAEQRERIAEVLHWVGVPESAGTSRHSAER